MFTPSPAKATSTSSTQPNEFRRLLHKNQWFCPSCSTENRAAAKGMNAAQATFEQPFGNRAAIQTLL